MKKSILNIVIPLLLIMGCQSKNSQKSEDFPQKHSFPHLTVGIQVSPAMTLVMVAKDKGFFEEAGVDVELKEFTAGKFALQAFLGGSLDIAISGEVPVTLATLQGNDFRVITQVVERTINECRVIVNKDDDEDQTAHEYFKAKKRKLSTSFGGGPEFFTYNFLKQHNIPSSQVELISQKPEDMPAALANGSVDGIAIFDPFARIAEVEIGIKGQTYADESLYSELYVADVLQSTIDDKPEQLKAFIIGLVKAESFMEANVEESKQIMIGYTKLDRGIVDAIWDNFVFKASINDLFIRYTTEQAHWAIEKGTFPKETEIPDFKNVLYTDFLDEVYPDAVNINQ